MKRPLLIQPHNDDGVLFACGTIIREQPLIITVYDSCKQAAQGITAEQRKNEDRAAMAILGNGKPLDLIFLGLRDDDGHQGLKGRLETFRDLADRVYAPAWELEGHPQHNLVATMADQVFPDKVTHYMTYTYTENGKSRSVNKVAFEPEWILRKLKALACYESQIKLPATAPHFIRDQYEYYE